MPPRGESQSALLPDRQVSGVLRFQWSFGASWFSPPSILPTIFWRMSSILCCKDKRKVCDIVDRPWLEISI